MSERLGALDASFLYLETPTTAMHVGGVATFAVPAGGSDYYPRLIRRISDRIGAAPRYRQKLCPVPGGLANPIWVDDPDFDLAYHVRHSTLPRPGSDAQLRERVARVHSRQLDRSRPLWELHLVEGLSDQRFALIIKIHHAMVDGIGGLDIGRLFFDQVPTAAPSPTPAAPPPSAGYLIVGAVLDLACRPMTALAGLPRDWAGARLAVAGALRFVAALPAAARIPLRSVPGRPLNTTIGTARRYAMAATRLDDYQRVRRAHGGTINDVVLATVTGALRGWLQQRGKPLPPTASLRALVPVNLRTDRQTDAPGNHVSAYLVDLPLGEPDPLRRLAQVSERLQRHKNAGPSAGPTHALITLAGLVPPPVHARGARAVGEFSHRLFNVVITNLPGPQTPLHVAGARMLTLHPVVPLAHGQAVSIGVLSYNGGVIYGLNADRGSMPDLDHLAGLIEQSLRELLDTVPSPAHHDVQDPDASPRLVGPDETGLGNPPGRVA